jgi:hypothetical protein
MQGNRTQSLIVCLLILLGFSTRLLPHPANFAPIGAIALFSALYLPKRYALIAPLLAMFFSDMIIGFYTWQTVVSVYVGFVLTGMIGLWVRERKSFATVLGGTLLGSVLFFLLTNGAVWAFDKMYPLNFSGLMQSYTMAIPFFKSSVMGDLFYTGVLVGGMEIIQHLIRHPHRVET